MPAVDTQLDLVAEAKRAQDLRHVALAHERRILEALATKVGQRCLVPAAFFAFEVLDRSTLAPYYDGVYKPASEATFIQAVYNGSTGAIKLTLLFGEEPRVRHVNFADFAGPLTLIWI